MILITSLSNRHKVTTDKVIDTDYNWPLKDSTLIMEIQDRYWNSFPIIFKKIFPTLLSKKVRNARLYDGKKQEQD